MNNIESCDKNLIIKSLETKNADLLKELQIYDCCGQSLIKELSYLKNILENHNIVY